MNGRSGHATSGFSLVEILLVLVVLGILVGVAGINFFKDLRKKELQQTVTEMMYQFEVARSTSVKASVDQTIRIAAAGSDVVLTRDGKTYTFKNLTMCVPAGSGCATTAQFTYRSPHGEMCWGDPCTTTDQYIRFNRNSNSLFLVLQGVFGYASIRNFQ